MAVFKTISILFIFCVSSLFAQQEKMASIKGGSFVPLYGATSEKPVNIPSFTIDVYPVTNIQFLAFIKKYPEYSRSKIKGIFADKSYLAQWTSDFDYSLKNLNNAPVTNVSWFAAKKYCECQGKRLPTMDEWEYVAMADEKRIDARSKKEFNKYLSLIHI